MELEHSSTERIESVLSEVTSREGTASRDEMNAEEGDDKFSNPLYRTSTDGTEVGVTNMAQSISGKASGAVSDDAYHSDVNDCSEQTTKFPPVQPHEWNEHNAFQVLIIATAIR